MAGVRILRSWNKLLKEYKYSILDGELSTGLVDRNGDSVYEGDTLDNGSYKVRVEWGLNNNENELYQYPAFVLRYLPNEGLIMSPAMPLTTLMTKKEISEMEII